MRTKTNNQRGMSKTSLVAIIGVVVIVAATGYYLLGYMSLVNNATFPQVVTTTYYDIQQANAPTTIVTTVYQTATVTGPSPIISVSIVNGTAAQKLLYDPSNIFLVIGVNNTVKWTNNDSALHTVTSRTVPATASSFDSGNMPPATVFTYTFTVPGNYTYYSKYDPLMIGTISVFR